MGDQTSKSPKKVLLFLCRDFNSAATAYMELEDQVFSEDPQQYTMKLMSVLSNIAYTLSVYIISFISLCLSIFYFYLTNLYNFSTQFSFNFVPDTDQTVHNH